MVRFLKCSRCPYDEKTYDIPGFTEHYAAFHIGDFYLYKCPSCQAHFASAFLAAHHMLTCWNPNVTVQDYSRPIDAIPFCNYQALNRAVEAAINEAIESSVKEAVDKHCARSTPPQSVPSEPYVSPSNMYPGNYNYYGTPYGDSDHGIVTRNNNCTSMYNNDGSNILPPSVWGDNTYSPTPHDSTNMSTLQDYGYQGEIRRSDSISPRRDRDRRNRGRIRRERSPSRNRDRSRGRRSRDRDRSRQRSSRDLDTRRRRERGMSPDYRTNSRLTRPSLAGSRSDEAAVAAPTSMNGNDRKTLPDLFDDITDRIKNPPPVLVQTAYPPQKPHTIVQVGRNVPKLSTGSMSIRGMDVFNTKNDKTDVNIELQSSKGSTQMFFNQELLHATSTYFAKIFASPEYQLKVEKKLSLHFPEVPFIDAMNYLHHSKVPWRTRCREGYYIVENLHRAYKVLQQAKDIEMHVVMEMAMKDLFLNRCNLANEEINCTGCMERVVLALHFDMPVPENIRFTQIACVKWWSDCDERSCAPELNATGKALQFIKKFLPAGYPGLNC